MFFNKEEIVARIVRRNRSDEWSGSVVGIHGNTRCKLHGFVAVGPLHQKAGFSWFDIRIRVGSTQYFELDTILKEACQELAQFNLHYQEVTR